MDQPDQNLPPPATAAPLPPNAEDRLRVLEDENSALRSQLEEARRELTELRAMQAVDVDVDIDEPEELKETDLVMVEPEGESAGFDVKTEEHSMPAAEQPRGGAAAELDAEIEPTGEGGPSPWLPGGTVAGSKKLQPLEEVEPSATPPKGLVAPDHADKVERKTTLAFVGAVVGAVILVAGIVGVIVYRFAAPEPSAIVAAPPPALPATQAEETNPEPVVDMVTPAVEPLEPAALSTESDEVPDAASAEKTADAPKAAKTTKPKPKTAKSRKRPVKRSRKSKKKAEEVIVVAPRK